MTALFEEAAWVWYLPESDSLVIRLMAQAEAEGVDMILVGKL